MAKFLLYLALLLPSIVAAQTCTTTISTGANVATTVSNEAAGGVVCLNSGNYGNVTLSGITKSPRVTIRSTTGQGATVGFTISGGTNGITVSSITASGMDISGSTTKNITIQDSNFGTTQFDVNTLNFNANNILIDNNYFGKWDATGTGGKEGRLSVTWSGGPGSVSCGVVITNNTFEGGYPGGCSDGVHLGSYGVVVGPGNRFLNIAQGSCSPHVDAIQGYGQSHTTVTGNYFQGNSVDIGFYDGGSVETFTDNVIQGTSGQALQIGTCANCVFTHNTVYGGTVNFNGKAENGPSTNLNGRNNILANGADYNEIQDSVDRCTNCVWTHNQYPSGGQGTDIVTGAPTWIGGTPPTTWAGWQLANGSTGENAGDDGQDMGTLYYGEAAVGPSAPANFRLVRIPAFFLGASLPASTYMLTPPTQVDASP